MLYIATCYSSNQWSGRVRTWSDTLCWLHLLVANRHELSIRRGIHAPLANAQRVFPRQEDIGDDLVAPAVVINPAVIATSWSWKTWKQRSLNSLLSQLKATTSTRGLLSSRPYQNAESALLRFYRTRAHFPPFPRTRVLLPNTHAFTALFPGSRNPRPVLFPGTPCVYLAVVFPGTSPFAAFLPNARTRPPFSRARAHSPHNFGAHSFPAVFAGHVYTTTLRTRITQRNSCSEQGRMSGQAESKTK